MLRARQRGIHSVRDGVETILTDKRVSSPVFIGGGVIGGALGRLRGLGFAKSGLFDYSIVNTSFCRAIFDGAFRGKFSSS